MARPSTSTTPQQPGQQPPNSRLMRAAQLLDAGDAAQAKALLTQTLAKSPSDPHALRMMRHALNRLGEHQAALYYAERALALAPHSPDALNLYGNSLLEVGRMEDAEETLRKAVALDESHALNHAALANVVSLMGKHVEAVELCEKGLRAHPGHTGMAGVLANVLMHTGQAERTVELLKSEVARNPADLGRLSMLCVALNYLPSAAPAEIMAAHCAYGRALAAQVPVGPQQYSGELDPERPLRIGFVSGDLRAHAVAFFAEPVLEGLDKSRFQIHAYQTLPHEDAVSERLKRIPGLKWLNTSRLPPMQMAQRIRQDRIDVLFDLAGHTLGNALPVFHLRPAPVQVSWLGYLCTTGVDAIQRRLTDVEGAPADAQRYSVETIHPLNPTACCYRPARNLPEIGPPPSEKAGRITFGSFSFSSKLNDATLRRWVLAMSRVRGSKLLVKNTAMKDPGCREFLAQRLARAGLAPDQIEVVGPTPDVRAHMEMYNRVDVALDTHPWPGITTVCDALTMGVPIVSMTGATALSRSCTPMLKAAGLGDLIVESDEAFAEAAARYAADVPRRAALRRELRQTFLGSPICDEPRFVGLFEGATCHFWKAHCAGKSGVR